MVILDKLNIAKIKIPGFLYENRLFWGKVLSRLHIQLLIKEKSAEATRSRSIYCHNEDWSQTIADALRHLSTTISLLVLIACNFCFLQNNVLQIKFLNLFIDNCVTTVIEQADLLCMIMSWKAKAICIQLFFSIRFLSFPSTFCLDYRFWVTRVGFRGGCGNSICEQREVYSGKLIYKMRRCKLEFSLSLNLKFWAVV